MFFRKSKCDFYFIQETHASLSDLNFWKSQWGDNLWMSYGSNRAAGVAILKGTFKGKIIQTKIHDSGRWVILVIENNAEFFILGNIYASNFTTQNKKIFLMFEDQIEKLVEQYSNAKLVLGGDFNSIWDSDKDCFPPRPSNRSVTLELNNLCSTFDLIDIWRHKYPEKIQFTWCNKNLSQQSRIDYWLISRNLINYVKEVSIEPSVLTDHKAIYLSLNTTKSKDVKTFTYWKMNQNILTDLQFKEDAKKVIKDCWNEGNSTNCFGVNWELMKYKIRILAIRRGKEIAKQRT